MQKTATLLTGKMTTGTSLKVKLLGKDAPVSITQPTTNRIRFFRGDNHLLSVSVVKQDPAFPNDPAKTVPVDLTTLTASKLSVKERASDATYLFQINGAVIGSPTLGRLDFAFLPAQTVGRKSGQLEYDVQLTLGGLVYTILRDHLELREDIT